jgi:hypothetical protein
MQNIKWKYIAELSGIAAILAGLVLVYFEIQQNGAIARAELVSGTSDQLDEIFEQLSDSDFSIIYAKSLHTPEELVEAERIQLNSFFERIFRMFGRERMLFSLGVFGEFEAIPKQVAPVFFSSGYGNIWWNARKETVNSTALAEIIDTALVDWNGRGSFVELDSRITEQIGNQ